MNKSLSIAFIAISLSLPGQGLAHEQGFLFPKAADYPIMLKEAHRAADFVPNNWKVLANASGDLSGDKLGDTALVIQGNFAKFKQKNSDMGVDVFDTNPRLLLICVSKPDGKGFRLAKMTKNIVGCCTNGKWSQTVICSAETVQGLSMCYSFLMVQCTCRF